MNPSSGNDVIGGQMVYGFLEEQSQIFYAFESYEHYQVFLEWMQTG